MELENFDLSIDNGVAHLVMKRPEKRNAMSPSFWSELPATVRRLDGEAAARVVVISSAGSYFSSGLDTSMFGSMRLSGEGPDAERAQRLAGPLHRYQRIHHMQDSFSALEQCRMPVIAAVQGGCIGGGLDMVAACCIRYASADAFFSIHEINVGMPADMGSIPRLTRWMPEGIVRELAYTGRRMTADEALQRGLVNQVFADHAALVGGALELARLIAGKAPLAVHGSKRLITYGRDHSTADTLDQVALWIGGMLPSEQVVSAARALSEKRPGDFVELPRLP